MSTNSRIAVMHGDVVKSVYCHWDGYLGHNGRILQEHYASSKANELVALGNLSSLQKDIGVQHPFSKIESVGVDYSLYDELYGDMCTFYGRDRNEPNSEYLVSHTFAEFLDQCDRCGAEYYYIMKDGVWYCGSLHEREVGLYKKLVLLSDTLNAELGDVDLETWVAADPYAYENEPVDIEDADAMLSNYNWVGSRDHY